MKSVTLTLNGNLVKHLLCALGAQRSVSKNKEEWDVGPIGIFYGLLTQKVRPSTVDDDYSHRKFKKSVPAKQVKE